MRDDDDDARSNETNGTKFIPSIPRVPARPRASPPHPRDLAGEPTRLRSSRERRGCDEKKNPQPRQTPGEIRSRASRTRPTDARNILNQIKKTYLGGSLGGHGGREDGGHRVCVRVLRLRVRRGISSRLTRRPTFGRLDVWTRLRRVGRTVSSTAVPWSQILRYTLHVLYLYEDPTKKKRGFLKIAHSLARTCGMGYTR